MYSATKLNMEAAIASLGTDHELLHFWWQGESDAMVKSTSYVGDFQVHRARKLSEVWYPETTPMIVMGVSPYYSDDLTHFNRYLTEVVSLDPRLSFVETGKLVPVPNWENAGGIYLHMTGSGFEAAGKLAHASRTKSFYNPATGHGLKFPYLSTFRHMRGAASPAAGSVITGWNLLGGPNPANRFDPASGAFSPSEDGLYAIGFSIANCPAGGALAVSIYKGDAVNAPYSIPGTQSVANAAYASAVHSTVLYLKRGEYVQLHLDMGKISTDPNQVCFWGYLVG
jgi:hypothetical protein